MNNKHGAQIVVGLQEVVSSYYVVVNLTRTLRLFCAFTFFFAAKNGNGKMLLYQKVGYIWITPVSRTTWFYA